MTKFKDLAIGARFHFTPAPRWARDTGMPLGPVWVKTSARKYRRLDRPESLGHQVGTVSVRVMYAQNKLD